MTLVTPIIEANLDAIRALCREYGVARLEVFDSAATHGFDPARSEPRTKAGAYSMRRDTLRLLK